MRKSALFVTFCSLLFLVGCNMNDNTQNDDTPMQDVERGVDDAIDDTRDVIDDTVDSVDPDGRNGQTNESTIDNNNNNPNPNVNVPNGSSGPNGDNGVTAPGAPSVNQEDIIEDRADRKDNDQIDNQ